MCICTWTRYNDLASRSHWTWCFGIEVNQAERLALIVGCFFEFLDVYYSCILVSSYKDVHVMYVCIYIYMYVCMYIYIYIYVCVCYSPPARWGLLDFMSVASFRLPPPSASYLLLPPPRPRPPAQLRPSVTVFSVGPQPRPSTPSVAQRSLPDLNREYPRPVFPAGPQPRPSTPSVPCRTSTASIHAKCSLPDLMRYAR